MTASTPQPKTGSAGSGAPAASATAPGAAAPSASRLVPAGSAEVKPLYPVARLIKGAVLEAEQERAKARQLLDHAVAEANRIVAAAEAQAETLLAQAREQGLREGYGAFRQLIESSAQRADQFTQRFNSEVTAVAFRIAREVLDIEFAASPQRIVELVKSAIEHLRSRFPQRILVHLHPDDFTIVQEHRGELASAVPADVQFSLIKDGDILRYDVVLETEMGHYDFSVASQLAELRKLLKA